MLAMGAEINGLEPMAEPCVLRVSLSDIAEARLRSASGRLLRFRQRGGAQAPRRLELKWRLLTRQELATILGIVSNEFFCVNYDDPLAGETRTARFCMTGNRTEALSGGLYGLEIKLEEA